MSLREIAEQDLQSTLEDENGFGWEIILTNLSNSSQTLRGQYHRISVDVDPESGLQIKKRKSSITIRTSTLKIGKIQKNWKAKVIDITGEIFEGYVLEVLPDDTIGWTTAILREGEN